MVRRWLPLALLVLCLLVGWFRYVFPFIQSKYMIGNDFLSFYAGGKLAFTPYLYDAQRAADIQLKEAGKSGEALRFIRLPFMAAALWPIAQLPFVTACGVWQTLLMAALVGFAFLWYPPGPRTTIMAIPMFIPTMTTLLIGQDLFFLLLWIALACRSLRKGDDFKAGLWMSLCVVKFHLFILIALVILARRMWRFAGGGAAGVTALLMVSFLTNGWDWPKRMIATLADDTVHPGLYRMPVLHVFTIGYGIPPWFEWTLIALVAACVWYLATRVNVTLAITLSIACGILVVRHAYISDCMLMFPFAMALWDSEKSMVLRAAIVVALSPPIMHNLTSEHPEQGLVPIAFLSLLALTTAFIAFRSHGMLQAMESRRTPECVTH